MRCGILRLLPFPQRMREEYRRIFGRKVRNIRLLNKTKAKRQNKASRIFGSRRTQRNRAGFAKYGSAMEFGQLQINYLDWEFQSARRKAELLQQYGIPVWVMEPLRGGKLAGLDAGYERTLKSVRPDEPIAAWAFRFLQSIPEVTVTLSGMSNLEQVKANIETYRHDKPLTDDECATLLAIADEMVGATKLPCTECRYCTAHCPKGLDIPRPYQAVQ